MKIEDIRELSQIMSETGLSTLEITEGGATLRLEKNQTETAPIVVQTALPATPVAVAPARGKALTSPLVGVFYAAPAPEAPAYVTVGSRVKVGDVLCIVEAMKLMNEITAEDDGEVLEICAASGQVVEYGQPLFQIG